MVQWFCNRWFRRRTSSMKAATMGSPWFPNPSRNSRKNEWSRENMVILVRTCPHLHDNKGANTNWMNKTKLVDDYKPFQKYQSTNQPKFWKKMLKNHQPDLNGLSSKKQIKTCLLLKMKSAASCMFFCPSFNGSFLPANLQPQFMVDPVFDEVSLILLATCH